MVDEEASKKGVAEAEQSEGDVHGANNASQQEERGMMSAAGTKTVNAEPINLAINVNRKNSNKAAVPAQKQDKDTSPSKSSQQSK